MELEIFLSLPLLKSSPTISPKSHLLALEIFSDEIHFFMQRDQIGTVVLQRRMRLESRTTRRGCILLISHVRLGCPSAVVRNITIV